MNFQIIINKKIVEVNATMSILQACESANIIVPKFCYHERLSVAGNCRMCLVEIDKAPKLVASCAMPVIRNMVVYTNSLAVKKAREGVLEFLLVNHPLDCAICDQAGECDLQDQTMVFGSDRSRFQEYKRAVEDLHCGPLIKTIMTRCIHCTRCVRFANEVIGVPDLGTSGRGSMLEINFYIKKLFKSEFSGNLIDLCPVGALTSKPYTFIARPWELKSVETIDTSDGIGSNIRIDTRGYEIMRILPRLNEKINEDWISDKTRFSFDGLKKQRLYEPLLKENNKFKLISWQNAFTHIFNQINQIKEPYKIGAIIGPQADLESMVLLQKFITTKNGVFLDVERSSTNLLDYRGNYLFNTGILKLEEADLCLLIGVNPRIDGAIINLRLRKRFLAGNFKVASFGSALETTIPVYNLGAMFTNLIKFIEGQHKFCKHFAKAKYPIIIIGESFLNTIGEKQGKFLIEYLLNKTNLLFKNRGSINFLNSKASYSGICDLGIKTESKINVNELLFLYSIGEGVLQQKFTTSKTFTVYQGHQGNESAKNANLILPGAAFTEKIATFVNVEGRYQKTKVSLLPPGNSKEDWSILFALLEKCNMLEKKDVHFTLKSMLLKLVPLSIGIKNISIFNNMLFNTLIRSKILVKNKFVPSSLIDNFYLSDTITKQSVLMSRCSKVLLERSPFFKNL